MSMTLAWNIFGLPNTSHSIDHQTKSVQSGPSTTPKAMLSISSRTTALAAHNACSILLNAAVENEAFDRS